MQSSDCLEKMIYLKAQTLNQRVLGSSPIKRVHIYLKINEKISFVRKLTLSFFRLSRKVTGPLGRATPLPCLRQHPLRNKTAANAFTGLEGSSGFMVMEWSMGEHDRDLAYFGKRATEEDARTSDAHGRCPRRTCGNGPCLSKEGKGPSRARQLHDSAPTGLTCGTFSLIGAERPFAAGVLLAVRWAVEVTGLKIGNLFQDIPIEYLEGMPGYAD